MSLEENRELVRCFNEEVWGRGRLDLIQELFAPDFVDHYQAQGGPPGRDGIGYGVARIRDAFPDLTVVTEDIICEGDKAVLRWSGHGTYAGGFPGIDARGQRVTMSGMHLYRIADGKIAERWEEFDGAAVMRQLTGP